MSLPRHPMLIAGAAAEPATGEYFESFNPYTGKPWALVARGGPADVEAAVQAAHHAMTRGPWARMTASERGLLMHRFADLAARHARRLAELEVMDNGKLLAEMLGQLNYVPAWYRYYGGLADKIEGAAIPLDKRGYLNYTRHEPIGVVAAITPWNSPLLLASWKLAPALAAGCAVVLKPSEHTSISTLEFAKLFEQAGFPPGVVNVVTGFGPDVGAPLVDHPLVAKVSFTGSDANGRRIAEQAARGLKHVSLELGGKSPNIVFDDADLDTAVDGAIAGIFAATGQTCIAGSRLLLQAGIHDAFVERLVARTRGGRMGNPLDAATQIAPVTTRPQYEKILGYLDVARGEGARVAMGGRAADRPECGQGWFVEPTVLTGVDNRMRIAQEEVFGPVLSVIRFRDEDEALAIANDIRFGLGSGVWTRDMGRAIRMADGIQAGTVWVNTYRQVSVMSPFCGYKESGLGRENGMEAVRGFLQTKSVWINTGAPVTHQFAQGAGG